MISRNWSTVNSFSVSLIEKAFMAAIVTVLVSAVPASASVSVEIGPRGKVMRNVIDAPNLSPGGGNAGSSWNEQAPPVELELPAGTQPSAVPAFTDIKTKFRHLSRPALNNPRRQALPASQMTAVLNAEGGDVAIAGSGTAIRVAKKDGAVEIEPYLYTRRQAKYVIHLFDVSGAEILFNAKPLFHWFRPDDTSNFPAFFKGAADPASMVQSGPGDFTAKRGLKYNFDIKKDQRIEIETQGTPEPQGFLKVKSEAF